MIVAESRYIDKSIIENQFSIPSFNKGSPQRLIAALKAHPLPSSAKPSDEEIENQVLELARNWE